MKIKVVWRDENYIFVIDKDYKFFLEYDINRDKIGFGIPLNLITQVGKADNWNDEISDVELKRINKFIEENNKEIENLNWDADEIKRDYESIMDQKKMSTAEAFGKREETDENILEDKKMGVKKITENELEKLIEKISADVREAHELLKEASELSRSINFDELKKLIDIQKYSDTILYIEQDLHFMQVGCISGLDRLYNKEYWDVLDKVYLEKNSLACLLDVLPDRFESSADEYMWEDLKNEFRKIAYYPNEDQEVIDKVYEFYENKTKKS